MKINVSGAKRQIMRQRVSILPFSLDSFLVSHTRNIMNSAIQSLYSITKICTGTKH